MPVFHHIGRAPAGIQTVLTYASSAAQSADGHFSSSMGIGTANPNRYIVVGFSGSSLVRSVSSVTVGGVACSEVVSRTDSTIHSHIYITNTPVASGTSATVAITWSSTGENRTSVGVWSLVTDNPTASATGSDIDANPSASVTVPVGGVAMAYCAPGGGGGVTAWAADFTSNFAANVEGNVYHAGATIATMPSAGGSKTATATTSGPDTALVVATWA